MTAIVSPPAEQSEATSTTDTPKTKQRRRRKPVTDAAQSPRLADARQVAALLGVSARHVFRLADAGLMPRPLRLGSAVRWEIELIEKWISSGCKSCREGGRR